MPYAFISRDPYKIVIRSPSVEELYKYIEQLTNSNTVMSSIDRNIIEHLGVQWITNESAIVKDLQELMRFEIDMLTVRISPEEATEIDWSGDLSDVYLKYFRHLALSPSPDLSDLEKVVIDDLSNRASMLDTRGQLKMFRDIINRRSIIKQYQDLYHGVVRQN
jgi:hypothetical protein